MTVEEQRKTVVMLGGSRLQVPANEAAQRLGFRVVVSAKTAASSAVR